MERTAAMERITVQKRGGFRVQEGGNSATQNGGTAIYPEPPLPSHKATQVPLGLSLVLPGFP